MSGIDIAGLALSIFPVVIEIVGWYGGMVKGRDTKLLAESLKNNQQLFVNSVTFLLRSVVPPSELKLLLENVGGSQWKDTSLNDRVVERLGSEANSIFEKIEDIYKTVAGLQQKLPATDNAARDENILIRGKKIIKCYVYGPHNKASLERLRIRITEFRMLTEDALKLASSPSEVHKALRNLSIVRECAEGLHDALKSGWRCNCDRAHPANIELDAWAADGSGEKSPNIQLKFSLLFADDIQHAQSDRWMTAEITPSLTPVTSRESQSSIAEVDVNLCAMLKESEIEPRTVRGRLGSISDSRGHNFDLFNKSDRPTVTPVWRSVKLAEYFREKGKLNPKNRVQLALMLAWGVLQISSTMWLGGKWTKENILLVMNDPRKPLPYISHRFESSLRRGSQGSTLDPETTNQIADWIRNTSLFALGVFMLELCYNQSIEDLAREDEKMANSELSQHTTFLTAMRLAKVVQSEFGLRFAEVVKACFNPDFDTDEQGNPEDPSQFERSMMQNIINPLKAVAESYGS